MPDHFETIGLSAQFAMHGEAATYLKSGQDPRAITVIVDREPPSSLDMSPGVLTPQIEIHVRNDSTHGIAASELDRGTDRISLPYRVGEAAKEYSVGTLIRQDRGVLVLGVNR